MSLLQNPFGNLTLVGLALFIAWVILLLPAVFYLLTTWKNRRELLVGKLGPEAIKLYYEQFFPHLAFEESETDDADEKSIVREFKSHFGRLYGRRHYILPLLLIAVLAAVGLRATAQSVQVWLGHNPSGSAYPPIVISAFLGAYAWVLYDHFRRFRTGDFTSHDIYSAVYRFLIAIPLGMSIAALLKDEVGTGVAFMLAAFPTTTLI